MAKTDTQQEQQQEQQEQQVLHPFVAEYTGAVRTYGQESQEAIDVRTKYSDNFEFIEVIDRLDSLVRDMVGNEKMKRQEEARKKDILVFRALLEEQVRASENAKFVLEIVDENIELRNILKTDNFEA